MKTLAFGKVQSVFVFVSGVGALRDEEWESYIKFLRSNLKPDMKPQSIVVTDGGGPSASQRKQLNDVMDPFGKNVNVAVVTASSVARGIVTALSWFNPVYQPFSPQQLDEAVAYVGLQGVSALELKRLIANLKKEVGAS